VGGILRFTNLGYSDYQGDEIKALFLPEPGQHTFQSLLDQRKGPVQFIITYLLKFANPLYQNHFLMRLPFAIAGFIAIYYFYLLVKEIFNEKAAFYASFFFATNGFLLAFSRIVQYQSFVIMFMIGALYYLKKKNIYLGLIFWAFSILSHYDGVFIFPLASYFIYEYLIDKEQTKQTFKLGKLSINKNRLAHFILSGIISVCLLAAFYIPFVTSVSGETQEYWLGRITGEVSDKLSSSKYLFSVYQPIYTVHIYLILFGLGIIFLGLHLMKIKCLKPKICKIFKLDKLIKKLDGNIDTKINSSEIIAVIIWTLFSALFMEGFVYIPGTHIYTYLIPAMIVMGYGILFIESIFRTKVNWLSLFGIATVFTFIFLQQYAIFVDNKYEYPWESEKFLIWKFPQPTPLYHLSMFGFPYYRDWEGIQKFIQSNGEQPAYSTNERKSIARYYIDLPKDTDSAGYFVYIKNPQSFTDEVIYEKAEYWRSKYDPVYVFNRGGRDLVEIFLMEPGTKEEIMEKGF